MHSTKKIYFYDENDHLREMNISITMTKNILLKYIFLVYSVNVH